MADDLMNPKELALLESGPPARLGHRGSPAVDLELQRTATYLDLRAYWNILLKRRWTVLTVAFVLATFVAIVCFKMRPVYQATARIEVEAEVPQIQSLTDLYRTLPGDEAFLQTQVNLMKSDNLILQTIHQLGLEQNPEFTASGYQELSKRNSESSPQAWLVRKFKEDLEVEVMRNSRMLEVSFESTSPPLAAQVANTLANSYLEYNFQKKYKATRQASGWMEQQLDELKAKVERSQQALVDYERQHAIVNISDKQNIAEQRLADLSKDFTAAHADRLQKESFYDLLSSNQDLAASIAQNQLLERLEERYADLRGQLVETLNQYGPNFPKVKRLRDQISEVQGLIDRERRRVMDRIRNDYQAALGRETLLSQAVAKEKTEVGKFNQLLIQHNILKREFETNQELYNNLLQRLKDATVSAGLRATNIHVVDMAIPPAVPVRPKKLLSIGIAAAVGLLLGIALAFVEEALDDSVKSAEEVEKLIAVPVLAIVPLEIPNGSRKLLARNNSPGANGSVALAVLNQPASALAESYRALRTSVLLSTAPRPPQALLVSSPQPNEGKTCVSLNLAMALAQRGSRVLIVDADLRRPGVAACLGISNDVGLTGVLTGAHTLQEALCQSESVPNLWVLPAGPPPPSPAELLSSAATEAAFLELRRRFEHLIVDSPPLLTVTDPTVLSALVDRVILVVESGITGRGALVRASKILDGAGAKVLGAVLNKVGQSHIGYYYGKYYGTRAHPGYSTASGSKKHVHQT